MRTALAMFLGMMMSTAAFAHPQHGSLGYRHDARDHYVADHPGYRAPGGVDPWRQGYRPVARPGFVWVDGHWDHGQWWPGC